MKAIEVVGAGLVGFVLVTLIIGQVITGSDTGSVLLQSLIALLVSFGIVFLLLKTVLKGGNK